MRATLVWDGECGFCKAWAMAARDKLPRDVDVIPWQEADLAALGLTEDACRTAVQWVDADGHPYAGPHAVARTFAAIGGAYVAAAVVLELPPVRPLAAAAYRWVAANRSRLPAPRPRGHAAETT